MTSPRRKVAVQILVMARGSHDLIEDFGGKKRVIGRADEKGWNANAVQPAERARPLVVVACVAKSVHRGGNDIIEIPDGAETIRMCVWNVREALPLFAGFPHERAEEVALVHA